MTTQEKEAIITARGYPWPELVETKQRVRDESIEQIDYDSETERHRIEREYEDALDRMLAASPEQSGG